MKKRVISLVLAVMMILTILPTSASANSVPTLKAAYSWTDKLSDSFAASVLSHIEVKFYLDDGDSESDNEVVPPSALTLPDFLEFESSSESGMCVIYAARTGSGEITYTKDNVTYTLPVTVSLPELGIYTSTDFTEANLVETFRLSASNKEFYVALAPELVEQGYKMTSVEDNLDDGIQTPSITTVAKAAVSDDGRYAAVRVTNSAADGSYHFRATVSLPDNGGTGKFGRGLTIENDMPKLYFRYAENRNGEWTLSDNMSIELGCVPGFDYYGCFYYDSRSDIENGSAEPISADALSFPAYLTAAEGSTFDSNLDGIVRIHVSRFAAADDTSEITCVRGGVTLAFSAATALPDIGFYTAPNASEDAFIYEGKPFTVTENGRTVYLCTKDSDTTITGISQWYTPEQEDLFDVTLSSDGSYLQLTLKEGASVPSFNVGVRVDLSVSRDGHTQTYWNGTQLPLKNGIPSLMARYLDWDDSTQKWVLAESQRLQTSLTLSSGDYYATAFFYGTEESCIPVDFSDLSFPNGVIRGYEENGAVMLQTIAYEGTGTVTYEKDGVSASLPVTVTPPRFGLYSSSTASAGAYLGSEVSVGSEGGTFYIVAADGFKHFTVREIWFNGPSDSHDATDAFAVTYSDDGSYATLAARADALPMGGSYRISLEGAGFGGSFEFTLARTDLPALTTPTGLSWHTEYTYYDGEDGSEEESYPRMGVMSFMPGAATQNRFTIELYSSADNYTAPVLDQEWHFGDTNRASHFSVSSFIYEDLPSGTYKFRVRALGDGAKYNNSEWSELSAEWAYTRPSQQLKAPDAADFNWVKQSGRYASSWKTTGENAAVYYEIEWYVDNNNQRRSSNFDIFASNAIDGVLTAELQDDLLQESGNDNIYFRVRAIPSDITEYRVSEYSGYSEPFDASKVTDSVNDKLDKIIDSTPSSGGDIATVKQVQDALKNDTEDLHTAMAADLDGTGGQPSGTLENIEKLEQAVSGAVTSKVEVANDAPQEIRNIEEDVTMIGAALNAAADSSSTEAPSVTLKIGKPDEDIVIDKQQHNAVQFSMKLSGAVDRDSNGENGQQLIVPILIDMPVPEGINPGFLVILHKLSSGAIEQIRPSIYFNETDGRSHARFVVSSFSDFAFVEYSFGFETDALTKYTDSGAFTLTASRNAKGSTVRYESSDPSVASVDPESGLVTIHKAGKVTITATASETDVYPEAYASYELTVTAAPVITPGTATGTATGTKPDTKPDDGDKPAFADVPSGAYYAGAVEWAVANGVTSGMADTVFAPNDTCTRAQMVTFLWRAAGSPEPKSAATAFADVNSSGYYAKAVAWAVEQGITTGTSTTVFDPSAPCTRAQVVTFLFRAAAAQGMTAVTLEENLSAFSDRAQIPSYAVSAMNWAVGQGILQGSGGKLMPNDDCTRAQIVTFLYRYFVK